MSAFYTYLISSLPALSFMMPPPFSIEDFLRLCESKIPREHLDLIKEEVFNNADYQKKTKELDFLKAWHNFNFALRAGLTHLRAARRKIDPNKYLKESSFVSSSLAHIASMSYRNLNILEAEKNLDLARWNFLDEALLGHYFDLECILAYALKLKILSKWHKISNANKEKILEQLGI